MTDRMTIDHDLLPVLDTELRGAAFTADHHAKGVKGLAAWAASAAVGHAAESLRRAAGTLAETASLCELYRGEVQRRANLLEETNNMRKSPDHTLGSRPRNDDFGYAYVGEEDRVEGFGLGLIHWDDPDGTKFDFLSWNRRMGEVDPENDRWGQQEDAQVLSATLPLDENPLQLSSLEIGGLTQNGDAHIGSDGATVGAGLAWARIAGTFGSARASSQDDTLVRLGVVNGACAAGRLHWRDEDGDGSREYGFGFDALFVSVDLKSEDVPILPRDLGL
jgi:hypothetical protein